MRGSRRVLCLLTAPPVNQAVWRYLKPEATHSAHLQDHRWFLYASDKEKEGRGKCDHAPFLVIRPLQLIVLIVHCHQRLTTLTSLGVPNAAKKHRGI